MKKKLLWLMLALAVLSAVGYGWYAYTHQKEKVNYILGTAQRGDITVSIDATGTIEPVNDVDLSATVSGTLKEVLVKQNQHVTKGQILAVIESKALTSTMQQAKDTVDNKESYYRRMEQLYKQDAVSYQDMEDARLLYLTSQSAYEKAVADVNDTVIVSPMDGYVIGEPMEVGETVSQGLSNQMIIITVADLSSMQIKLLVDETDIGEVQRGQAVTFTVDAYPDKTFHGTVRDISKQKYSTSTSGTSSSSSNSVIYYTVYIDIQTDEIGGLYPAMTARAEIQGKRSENALLVPTTAIRSDSDGEYVYKKTGKELNKVRVSVGITSDNQVEIMSGLSEGDEIVIGGAVTAGEAAAQVKKAGAAKHPRL